MEPLTSMPNLPHFRANKPKLRGRGGDFKFTEGAAFFEQVPQQQVLLDLQNKTAATSLGIRRGTAPTTGRKSPALGAGAGAPTAGYVTNSGLVLQFDAYFKEAVDESPLENHRVRKCKILVYLEDSSVQIDEYRQENSGMPQGTLVKRHQIPYPEGRPGSYTVDDISVGGTIDVYGRRFHVVDANGATRRLLEERWGRFEAPAIPFPVDRYTVERKEFMSRQTGCDPNVQHKIIKNDMKLFAEATLGNTVDNSKRAGFIKYDRNVLRFQAVWDDRESLYGDIQRFEMHYFLSDDTIEIRAVHGPNSGRDPVPVLVKRGRIPKSIAGGAESEPYHWSDFDVGVELNVYERPLVLVDADGHTREFYATKGIRLGDPVLPPPATPPVYEPPLLPPTVDSFTGGDDDDDLVSRSTSLIPSPPRKIRGEDVMFRYTAELKTGVPEDDGRLFIITYFKADRTVVVREPPKRNSGIIGGNFLSRMKVRDSSGNVITEGCFYVGAEVTFHGHCFRITTADDKTLRLMEERATTPGGFVHSDPVRAAELLSGWVEGRAGQVRAFLRERDVKETGQASRADLLLALESAGGVEFGPATPEQAVITLMRAVGGDSFSAPYDAVVDRLVEPGGFQHGL
eukprot:g5850.t1